MIRISSVNKSFDDGATFVVSELDFSVDEGALVAVIGESGCGKTTTLKMINRLVEPTSGTIEVEGEDVTSLDPVKLRRRIGYVFQGIGLFPHYTVGRNVGAVLELLDWSAADRRARIDEMLELVGMPPDEYRDRLPRELSGGQRQRVGVARALAARPRVLLMDEPFGALDPITRADIQDQFLAIQKDLELTVVMVTHDMTEALLMADRVAVMKDGRMLQNSTPHEILSHPNDDYVRELIEMPKRRASRLDKLLAETEG